MAEAIDFVVTWVDGADKNWLAQKAEYTGVGVIDDSEERYRDWEILRYWFRGVEKCAPWVRKVHFITWGHLPEWLNTENPKLHIVKHEDYIPEQYRPTFNSNIIELHMHKIEGLAEQFVYFNDDMCLLNSMKPEDFFADGKVCDMLAFQPVVANPKNPVMSHTLLNNSLVICKYFDKRENVKRNLGNYFKPGYPLMYFAYNLLEMAFPLYTGFYTVHGPSPFFKSTYEELWEKEKELFEKVSENRIRCETDISQYLFRDWQKLNGRFKPTNLHKKFSYFNIGDENTKLYQTIRKGKSGVICLNDGPITTDWKQIKRELIQAFEERFPEKSSFERD